MSTARKIQDFLPTNTPRPESGTFVGHLMRMPLTDGEEAMVDPEETISVSSHRAEKNVTVIRQRSDNYTYFVDRPYTVVKGWMLEALGGFGHLLVMPLTNGEEVMLDPEEINGVSPHRDEEQVTVVRQRNDAYVYFVALPYETVKKSLADALR